MLALLERQYHPLARIGWSKGCSRSSDGHSPDEKRRKEGEGQERWRDERKESEPLKVLPGVIR
jgi:hypothetical protein